MNSVLPEPLHWNWRRWLMLFILISAAQLLLIYFLSAQKRFPSRPETQHVAVELSSKKLTESQFNEMFLASDPTLFVLPNRHGFSGAAWLKVPPHNYDLAEQTKPPYWLGLDSEKLGNSIIRFVQTNALSPLPTSENPEPTISLAQIMDDSKYTKTNSRLRIEGDLVARKPIHLPKLKSWPNPEILSNSIVQIAADKSGMVVSARLISRSGNSDADRSALETGRQLQFSPGKEIVWGNVIFDWHTIPVVVTNSAAKAGSP